MNTRQALTFLGILGIARVVWLSIQGVSPQEAYYSMCGDRLAAAFFDGPPGTAFLLHCLSVATAGSLELARLAWPVIALLASWLAYLLARTLRGEVAAGWTIAILNALPVFNEHATNPGPAMPALALVLAGILAAQSAREGRWMDWAMAALFFSLAALFRYEAVLVPLGFALALLAPVFRKKTPDLRALAPLVLFPIAALWFPLAWNSKFEWIPIAGGTLQTLWTPRPWLWGGEFLAYIREFSFPAAFVLPAALVLLAATASKDLQNRFLLCACAPAAVWALCHAVLGRGLSGGAWLACVPLVVAAASAGIRFRWMAAAGSIVVAVALFSTLVHLREAGLMRAVWSSIAQQVHQATREMPASEGGGFLVAENAAQASILSTFFKSASPTSYPPVFVHESPALTSQFGIWPSYADFIETDRPADEFFQEQKGVNPFVGRNALYLGSELPQTIKGAFGQVTPLRRLKLPDGTPLTIFLCLDYQTLPL